MSENYMLTNVIENYMLIMCCRQNPELNALIVKCKTTEDHAGLVNIT